MPTERHCNPLGVEPSMNHSFQAHRLGFRPVLRARPLPTYVTVVDVNYGELAPDQPKPDVAMIIAAWFDANCEMRHCNLPSTIFYIVEERTLLERLAEDEAMDVAESSI